MKITKQHSDGFNVITIQPNNAQFQNVEYVCICDTNGKPFVIVRQDKEGTTDYAIESIAMITENYFSTLDFNLQNFTSKESTRLLEEKLLAIEHLYIATKNIKNSFTKELPSYDIAMLSSAINLTENTLTTTYPTFFSLDRLSKNSMSEKELVLLKFNDEVVASISTSVFTSVYSEKVLTNALYAFEYILDISLKTINNNELSNERMVSLLTNLVGVLYRTTKNPHLRDIFKYEINYVGLLEVIIGKQVLSIDENCGIYVDYSTNNIIYIESGIKEKISF